MTVRTKTLLLLGVTLIALVLVLALTSSPTVLAIVAVASLAFLVGALFLTEKLLLARISRLDDKVSRIRQQADISERVEMGGSDEVSRLGLAIDHMLDELQQAQRLQAESQQRYRAVAQQSHDGLAILDARSLRILEANSALQNLLGVYPPHVFDLTLADLAGPSDDLAQKLDGLLEGGGALLLENRLKRAFGSTLDLEISISAIRDGEARAYYASVRDVTERKQASRELQFQRDFAVQVMSAMGQGLAVTDAEGCFDFVNPALARLLGTTPDKLLGRSLTDLAHPEDLAAPQVIQMGWTAGNVAILEMRLVRADGASLYTLVTAAPRRREDEITGAIVVVTDLTERRRVEETLVQSEARYRSVVEGVSEVIFQTSVSGRWAFLNPAWSEITGFALEESVGGDLLESVAASEREELSAALRAVLAGERESARLEARFITRERGERWMAVDLRPLTGREGEILGTTGTLNDVTERRLAEDALRKSEEFIRALYQIAASRQMAFDQKVQALLEMGCRHFDLPTGFLARLDGDGHELLAVVSGEGMLARGERLGLDQLFSPDVAEPVGPLAIQHAAEQGWAEHPACRERGIQAYLGTPVAAQGEMYAILGFCGRAARALPFSNAEQEFLRLMAQWIGAEVERDQYTHQLQLYASEIASKNRTLAEARDQALDASRMKSTFLATMSHEIRTPMNSVLGMAELLLNTPLNKVQREYASIVQESAQLLLALINDILDFSKIEAGRLELEQIEFSLEELVEGAVELFASRAEEKHLALVSRVDASLPDRLVGDPTRLRQILVNLVGNAIKFTPSGEVVLRVEPERADGERLWLRFSVADTGIGVSQEARARMFDPFSQAEPGTTRKYGGTGLGLAIARHLVELMEGEIDVASSPGEGSRFWFTIPLGRGAPQAAPPTPDLARVRALVIDPSPARGAALRVSLAGWGARVDYLAGSAGAVERLRTAARGRRPYHLVLVSQDVRAPDPLELAATVRAEPTLGQARLVLVSSFDDHTAAARALEAGCAASLPRPVRQARLAEAVTEALALPVQPPIAAAHQRAPELAAEAPAGKRPILLADDNPANQKLAQAQLQRLGYTVDVVSNGRQAVEALIEAPARYGLVLMDCQMPEVDGFAAARIIRQFEIRIPIIALTASAQDGDREACRAAGMDDYVTKPVSLEVLMRVLERWLQPATADPAGSAAPQPEPAEDVGPPLDRSVLEEIRALQTAGEDDFLAHLIDTYLRESQRLAGVMRQAWDAEDRDALGRAAHTLKGSSGNLGARRLADLAAGLEAAARDGEPGEVGALLEAVLAELVRASAALEVERGERA